MRWARLAVIAGLVAVVSGCGVSGGHGATGRARREAAPAAFGRLPLLFERNVGQTDPRVRFLARSAGSALFFTPTEAVLAVTGAKGPAERVLRMRFPGAAHPLLRGAHRLASSVNYLRGRERSRWRTRVPVFARLRYVHLWRGINASFYGTGRRLEYDFELAAGADPAQVAFRFVGAQREYLDAEGNLVLKLPGGGEVVRELAPVAYQRVGRVRRAVACRFVLSAGVARLALGSYDHRRPLIVDPALVYSTYLGGSAEDVGNGTAVDSTGNAYVTGFTSSTNFPAKGAEQLANGGGQDAFVTKLNAAGNAVAYSTYLGGTGSDIGHAITVDSTGSAYVAGSTDSPNFPTQAPEQAASGGGEDAFVAKLNATGQALVYSTYLGGSSSDLANSIAIDAADRAYVSGPTISTDFPTRNPLQPANGGGEDTFATKLTASGGAIVYSTYLGGSGADQGNTIAVNGAGEMYLTGITGSANFPTHSPLQPAIGGGKDAFVAKLDTTGRALVYSTYLGGAGDDAGNGIATDTAGDAYVTGSTSSTNFPTVSAAQSSCGDAGCSNGDAFVTKLNPAGNALAYSTYIGGSGADQGNAIAVDGAGEAHVTGGTFSGDFPTRSPEQLTPGGSGDAFVTKLTVTGAGFVYSTYLGGTGTDIGYGIALGATGDAFVTGWTTSTNFPTLSAAQPSCGDTIFCGQGDAFVTRLPADITPPVSSNSVPTCHGPVTVTVSDETGGSGPGAVHFRLDGGAEQVIATVGNPGIASIPIPEGNHILADWGQDAAGNLEFPHHVGSVQVDTTPPPLSIAPDRPFTAYEVGDRASVTVMASDATSGLVTDPSASHVPISTATPGRFAVSRSAIDRCGNRAAETFTYVVIPFPVLAVTVNVEVTSGTVRIRKGGRFVALTEPRAIPVGSTIDATMGTIRMTTATAKRGRYQAGKFRGGLFKVLQRRSQHGLTELRLIGKGHPPCLRAASRRVARNLSRSALRLLYSNAHGRFRTRGRWSAATVRGTQWTTVDRCDGTLTIVTRGTVLVRDFRLRRTIAVHAGHRYLARAR